MKTKVPSLDRAKALPGVQEEVARLEAYLRAEKRSARTSVVYAKFLRGFLEWFGKKPELLTDEHMLRWKEYLSVKKHYCENTMSTMIAAVNQYTKRVLKRPDLEMRPPRRVIRTKIPLTEEEVSRILEEAGKRRLGKDGSPNNADASLRDHAAICLMYFGGLRVSETTSLRISDLDLEKKKLRVHGGKGNDYSMVNLTDEAVASIRAYLDHGRPTPRKPEYADYLILSIRGSLMKGTHLWPRVKKAAFGAGIEKNVSPHIFRHSMITHMAEKGISASLIQAQSRHKSLDMVQRYTHLSEPVVREAYDHAFSKQAPQATVVESAQEQSISPKIPRSTDKDEDRKTKLLDLYLDGKIADDRLEKLLSIVDRTSVNKPVIAGYV